MGTNRDHDDIQAQPPAGRREPRPIQPPAGRREPRPVQPPAWRREQRPVQPPASRGLSRLQRWKGSRRGCRSTILSREAAHGGAQVQADHPLRPLPGHQLVQQARQVNQATTNQATQHHQADQHSSNSLEIHYDKDDKEQETRRFLRRHGSRSIKRLRRVLINLLRWLQEQQG